MINEAIAPVGFGPHCVAVQEHTFVAFLVGVHPVVVSWTMELFICVILGITVPGGVLHG